MAVLDGPIIYPTGSDVETGAAYVRTTARYSPRTVFFAARELHKRIATLHHELGLPPFHIAHSTGGCGVTLGRVHGRPSWARKTPA